MDHKKLLTHLLREKPENICYWVKNVEAHLSMVPDNFNWLGLAEGAVCEAETLANNNPESFEQALLWAKVAVISYEYMLNYLGNRYDRFSLENSLMLLRSFFILKVGPVEKDPVLGTEQIVHWFFQDLLYSQQELRELIQIWQNIKGYPLLLKQLSDNRKITVAGRVFQADMVRNMRILKNKLKILKALFENGRLSPTQKEELNNWVLFWEQLP